MYNNIGKKIKGLAWACFIIWSVNCLVCGFLWMLLSEKWLALGLVFILVGPILAWIGTWVLYGFGELVDKTCEIKDDLHAIKKTVCVKKGVFPPKAKASVQSYQTENLYL